MQNTKTTNTSNNTPKIIKNNKTPINKTAGISYLNLIALGPNIINIAYLLTSIIIEHNCNIVTNNVIELNQDIAFSACICGKWNNIVKLEKSIALLTNKHQIHIHIRRSPTDINTSNNNNKKAEPYIYYIIQTTTIDKPGVLNKLFHFFNKEQIDLKYAKTTPKAYNASMIDIEIHIKLPADLHILSFRDRFLTYCDELNLDASLEPMN